MRACVRACVRECVRGYVRACVCACACACVCVCACDEMSVSLCLCKGSELTRWGAINSLLLLFQDDLKTKN